MRTRCPRGELTGNLLKNRYFRSAIEICDACSLVQSPALLYRQKTTSQQYEWYCAARKADLKWTGQRSHADSVELWSRDALRH